MCLEKFCGKCCEMHKNPVNCLLHLIGAIMVIIALWCHSLEWILIGILLAVIGHIVQAAGKRPKESKKKKR